MTVIATDGVTLAADSLTMFGQERSLRPARKIVVESHLIYAASGVAIIGALIEWHHKGADPEKLPRTEDEGWGLLVINPDRQMYYYHKKAPYPLEVGPLFTLGTGGEYALGAMLAGASPQQAAEIACKVNSHCGGDIQVIDIAEALGLNQQLQAAE